MADVNQADRDFASSYLRARSIVTFREAQAIIDGAWDETPHVLEVAKHRLASRPDDRPTSVAVEHLQASVDAWDRHAGNKPAGVVFEYGNGLRNDANDLLRALADAPPAPTRRAEEAAAELPGAEGTDWRTIESAPKDGTAFLAAGGGCGEEVLRCRWIAGTGAWDCEITTLEDWDDQAEGYSRPKTWCPLPAAPAIPDDRPTSVGDEDARASAYAAEYVMSTEGGDYVPTDWERVIIEDALHGFLADAPRSFAAAPVMPVGGDREVAFRAGYRLGQVPDAYCLSEDASWGEWLSRNSALRPTSATEEEA